MVLGGQDEGHVLGEPIHNDHENLPPSELGKFTIRSMDKLSHGCSRISKGSNNPARDLCSDLSCR